MTGRTDALGGASTFCDANHRREQTFGSLFDRPSINPEHVMSDDAADQAVLSVPQSGDALRVEPFFAWLIAAVRPIKGT
jgi:hypothetical protein